MQHFYTALFMTLCIEIKQVACCQLPVAGELGTGNSLFFPFRNPNSEFRIRTSYT
jgi:hypothetical protein